MVDSRHKSREKVSVESVCALRLPTHPGTFESHVGDEIVGSWRLTSTDHHMLQRFS